MVAFPRKQSGLRFGGLLIITCIALAAAACSSSGSSSPPAPAKPTGTANVAAASSLSYLNEKVVGPSFTKAEGYKYSGTYNASGDLESDIASGEITPNVFESVGGDNITPLEPKFTKWYVQYAGTSMVVAYNPNSKYASQFKAYRRRHEAAERTCSRCCRRPASSSAGPTPTSTRRAGTSSTCSSSPRCYYHLPSDTVTQDPRHLGLRHRRPRRRSTPSPRWTRRCSPASSTPSSAFITQAIELHLDYIPLPAAINLGDVALAAQYAKATITITSSGAKVTKSGSPQVIDITIIGKPTPAGIAFVKYTLSPAGLAQYKAGRIHAAHADGDRR